MAALLALRQSTLFEDTVSEGYSGRPRPSALRASELTLSQPPPRAALSSRQWPSALPAPLPAFEARQESPKDQLRALLRDVEALFDAQLQENSLTPFQFATGASAPAPTAPSTPTARESRARGSLTPESSARTRMSAEMPSDDDMLFQASSRLGSKQEPGGPLPQTVEPQPRARSGGYGYGSEGIATMTCSRSVALVPTANLAKKAAIWPTLVRIRETYANENGNAEGLENAFRYASNRSFFRKSQMAKYAFVAQRRGRCCGLSDNFCFHPDSKVMVVLDLLGVVMVMLEVGLTPVVLAWDLPVVGKLQDVMQVLLVFWIWDFLVCCNTGFYQGGQLHFSRSGILLRYLSGWMIPDLALIFVDIMAAILQGEGQQNIAVQTLRICRVLKVLRISRLVRFVQKAMAWSLLLSVRFAVQIIPVVLMSLLSLHILTCIWFAIGTKAPSNTGARWTDAFRDTNGVNGLYEYMTALHWTVAQMTLGAIDVGARTSAERSFNIFVLLIALLSGSTLISVISAQVSQIVVLKQENMIKLSTLRRYLLQENVSHQLSMKVQRQAINRLNQQGPIAEERVHSMKTLSSMLQLELRLATRVPRLIGHALFRSWANVDLKAVEEVCNCAISFCNLVEEDDLFLMGEVAECAYLVASGLMEYLRASKPKGLGALSSEAEIVSKVYQSTWVAEAALWCHWTHVGRLTAIWKCQVMALDASMLERAVRSNASIAALTSTYAKNYYQRVLQAMPPASMYPDDLSVPFTEPSDLLSKDIDLNILRLAVQHGAVQLGPDEQAMLEAELKQGRCCLQTAADGSVMRTVGLVALQLRRDSGELFVQVGKWTKNGGVRACCQLPGSKRNRGELPPVAVQRLLSEDLAIFKDRVELEAVTHSWEIRPSPRYGVETNYSKAIFDGQLLDEPALQAIQLDPTKIELDSEDEEGRAALPTEIYFLADAKGEFVLYAWVPPASFELLRGEGMRDALGACLSALDCERGCMSSINMASMRDPTSSGFAASASWRRGALPPLSEDVAHGDSDAARRSGSSTAGLLEAESRTVV